MQLIRISSKCDGWALDLYASLGADASDKAITELEDNLSGIEASNQEELHAATINFDASSDVVSSIQLKDHTAYLFTIDVPFSESDIKTERNSNPIFPFKNVRISPYLEFNGPDSCKAIGSGYRLTGRLNFGPYAGMSDLSIGTQLAGIEFPVHVFSGKLAELEEFHGLLDELARHERELMLELDAGVQTPLRRGDQPNQFDHTLLLQLRRIFNSNQLQGAIAEIINNPTTLDVTSSIREELAFANEPDLVEMAQNPLASDWRRDGPLAKMFRGWTPTAIPNRHKSFTKDTIENQYVKQRLELLLVLLQRLREKLPQKYESSRRTLTEYFEVVRGLLQHSFWQEIGSLASVPSTAVMLQRAGYREFLNLIHILDLSLEVPRDSLSCDAEGDLKPTYELYEIWVYLKFYEALCNISGNDGDRPIEYKRGKKRYNLELYDPKRKPITFSMTTANGKDVQMLLYNEKEFKPHSSEWQGTYSGTFNPDVSIQFVIEGTIHWLHFDAKFRLSKGAFKEQLKNSNSTYQRDDIHKMHTYRDAILGSRGSYAIYPGIEEAGDIFVRHGDIAYREGNVVPSVGAFPLRPGSENMERQSNAVQDFILLVLNQLTSSSTYSEELGIV